MSLMPSTLWDKKEPQIELLEKVLSPSAYMQEDDSLMLRFEETFRNKNSARYIRMRLYHLFRLIKDDMRENHSNIYPFPTIHQKGTVLMFEWKRNKHMNTWEEIVNEDD